MAVRTAGRSYFDASEGVLEAIIEHQGKLNSHVDQGWLADVIDGQAEFTRQLLKLNAAQRELSVRRTQMAEWNLPSAAMGSRWDYLEMPRASHRRR